MKKIGTLQMIEAILKDNNLRFKSILNGKEIVAFYNKNGGISYGKLTLNLSGEMMLNEWEKVNESFTFMEAVNSKKKIKYEDWKEFKTIQEALYDLLDYQCEKVIKIINGPWNIAEEEE